MRRLIAGMLTLVLLITSGTMAVARGHMASTAMLHVLCIDGEVQVVALGADGAPVEDHPACPDCTLGALLALCGPEPFAVFTTAAGAAAPALPPTLQIPHRITESAQARGPPASV